MSYEPTNWKTGDVVTSAKLNKLENGVANSGNDGTLIVTISDNGNDGYTSDKSYAKIAQAFDNCAVVIVKYKFQCGIMIPDFEAPDEFIAHFNPGIALTGSTIKYDDTICTMYSDGNIAIDTLSFKWTGGLN